MTRQEIYNLMRAERIQQASKWHGLHEWGRGDCSSADVSMLVKAAVLAEECGEVMQAVLTAGPDEAAKDPDVRQEIVQVLAVAHAILEGL